VATETERPHPERQRAPAVGARRAEPPGPTAESHFRDEEVAVMVEEAAAAGLSVMAHAQATEGIKLLTGIGDPMIGRLGLYDALDQQWTYVKVNKDPNCPVCGENPTVTELIDYEEFCGMPAHDGVVEADLSLADLEILPTEYVEIAEKPDVALIDVREPHEWEINRIPGAVLIPKDELPGKLAELDPTVEYVVHCKSGMRSLESTELLRGAGFKARSMRGGIDAYARQIDPEIPVY
jgi:sulfur-carrier protein adenylyltransferase/sulfurtransferase